MTVRFLDGISEQFGKAPIAWSLAALLAVSVFFHGLNANAFADVCRRFDELREGYFDLPTGEKLPWSGIDWNAVSLSVRRHDELMKEDTVEGRAYRWRWSQVRAVEKKCSHRRQAWW